MFWRLVFFLSHFVLATCNQDELLKCRPRSGCIFPQCDAVSGWPQNGVSAPNDYEYSILCQHQENQGNPSGNQKLEEQVKEILGKFDDMQKENADLRKELFKLEGRLEKSEDENYEVKSRLEDLEEKDLKTDRELTEAKNEIGIMQAENLKMKTETEELQGELKKATSEISVLRKENSKTKTEMVKLREELKEAKNNVEVVKRENLRTKTQVANLQKKLHGAIAEITSLENENADVKGELKRIGDEVKLMKTRMNKPEIEEPDPCQNDACHKNAKCVRDESDIGFKCVCYQGYFGNGYECKLPCDDNKCHKHARCIPQSDGGHQCTCISMYTGDGIRCKVSGSCTGMRYDNKCFVAVKKSVDHAGAVAECESHGARLANLYSQKHMNDIMEYIRKQKWFGGFWMNFGTGLNFDPLANKLTLRDGADAPDGLKWAAGDPSTGTRYADRTNVILRLLPNPFSIGQYLWNNPPTYKSNVLCEIE